MEQLLESESASQLRWMAYSGWDMDKAVMFSKTVTKLHLYIF